MSQEHELPNNENETHQLPKAIDNLEIFPFKFEQILFDHLFALLILGPYLTLVVLGGLYALLNGTFPYLGVRWTAHLFTDPLFITIMIVLAAAAVGYLIWYKNIKPFFHQLLKKNFLTSKHSDKNIEDEFFIFITNFQQHLWSKWRYLFIALLFIFYFIFIFNSRPYTYFWVTSRLFLDIIGLLHITVMYVLFPILAIYVIGAAMWPLFATGKYIYEIPKYFDLKIQPSHPDRSGGLKSLGDFAFRMALPLLMAVVGISTLVIFIKFYWVANNESNTIASLILLYSPLVLAMIYFAFFGPLWSIHNKMKEIRNDYQEKYAIRWGNLIDSFDKYLESGDLEQAEKSKRELELLTALHPEKVKYPTWPFDTQLFIRFLLPQLFPFASFIVGLQSDSELSTFIDFAGSLLGQ